jgi:hypothetical protein
MESWLLLGSHRENVLQPAPAINSVFALETMLGARGRYILGDWTQDQIQRELRTAQEGLNTFRSLARGHRPTANVRPKSFVTHLGLRPSRH